MIFILIIYKNLFIKFFLLKKKKIEDNVMKIRGHAWIKPMMDIRIVFFFVCFSFDIPLYTNPRHKTISERLRLCANSPDSVLGIFPPHMELDSIKRKARLEIAPKAGAGKGNRNSLTKR